MYVGETTCDGKKKAWEILAGDVPVHVMDLPQMKREKDIQKWAEEIKDFKAVVEKETGNEVTAEKLAASIKTIFFIIIVFSIIDSLLTHSHYKVK